MPRVLWLRPSQEQPVSLRAAIRPARVFTATDGDAAGGLPGTTRSRACCSHDDRAVLCTAGWGLRAVAIDADDAVRWRRAGHARWLLSAM